jgi:DNA replication protein DnaC
MKTLSSLVNGESPWPLLLTGPPHSGKTCAALCVIDDFGGWYITVPEFCERLIAAQRGELEYRGEGGITKQTPRDVWREVRRVSLFVLDELGMREVSDHHYDCVKRALDAREGKPAIYISNLSLVQLLKLYDDRIRVRLASGTAVTLTSVWRDNGTPKQENPDGQG